MILVGFSATMGNVVHAQAYRPQVFSIEEGLAQSQILSMCQDRRGYIWMGTKTGGVSRFDGRSFKTFTTDDGLLGNEISVIAEDPHGNLWFACTQRGLCWYDGYRFRSVSQGRQAEFETASDIYCGPTGDIWLATLGQGLFVWNGREILNFREKDGLASDSVYCVEPMGDRGVWVGTTHGISSIMGDRVANLDSTKYLNAPRGSVVAITHLHDGTVVGSRGAKYWRLEGNRFVIDTIDPAISSITSILEDNEGNLWMTGDYLAARISKNGAYRLGVVDGLKETGTNCLLRDGNGNIWIGTNGAGAIRYSPEAFTMYGAGTPFVDHSVFSVIELEPDRMLVGTERGLFELKGDKVEAVADFPDPNSSLTAIRKGVDGAFVIASNIGRAIRWDGKTFKPVLDGSKSGDLRFRGLAQNAKGEIIGATNKGLYKIGPDSAQHIDLAGVNFKIANCYAYMDHQSRYWFFSATQDLYCLENGLSQNLIEKHDLEINSVFDLNEDANQVVWIATDNGIMRFRGEESCYLTTRDGLSGNVVYLLQMDALGNLWAGTGNGLTRIVLDKNSDPIDIDTYGKAEGFTGIECNQNASCMDSKGRLWFGTIEGLSCYHPESDVEDMMPPQVEITDFRVHLEKIDWAERGVATAPWTNVPINPVLKSNEEDVRIQFAGVTQHLGEKVKYRYALVGLDDTTYSEASTENYRVYSPLQPGEYTFKVIACNANGVWTKEPATLHFTIRTPFWKTSWFGLIAFLSIILMLLGIIRIRTNTLQRQRAMLELKVKQRTEALEQANQVKGEFLAKMSHEIRTPMNGVIGMTDLLERTALTPQQRKFVETIRISGQSLLSLINDILDFSRIESGKMDMEHIPFDLRHIMEEVMDILSFSAFSKGLELLYWVDPAIRGPVMGDPARFKQILTNLVGNAIKFTSKGEITLRAKLIKLEGDIAHIQCSVKDSGIGIPKEKHSTLFESFTQVDASTTRKYGGTGLGLAISYNLSRMMGGEMWLESESGKGSEFFFSIKVGTSGPWYYPGDSHPAKTLEGTKVVVAMQHAATKALLGEYLTHWGVEMEAYDSVEAASDAALDGKNVLFFLVDLRLSRGEPAQFARRMAASCAAKKLRFGLMAEPDIAISLMNVVGELGWVLPKPLKRDDLLQALTNQRIGNEVQATRESLASLATQIPLRILVAEDNPINQDVANGMLSSLGYNIQIAQDGKEALEVALKGEVELIFMDVQMPVMDGLEATRKIVAAMSKEKRPLIVAMTANAMESDRQKCLEAGMDTFISKPFLMNELVRMLRTVPAMRSAKQPDAVEVSTETVAEVTTSADTSPVQPPVTPQVSPPTVEPETKSEPSTNGQPKYKLTDMAMLDGVSNGEADFVLGILTKLVAKLPEAVQELRVAAEKGDWEIVRATAHRNKSSAAYSGSEALRDKFKDLEHLAREREHLDLVPTRLDELDAFVTAVVAELKDHIAERTA